MHRQPDTVKTLTAVFVIAFASTVSAVHVHDNITYSHTTPPAVQNMYELHDCIFCWVVYQTVTADAEHSRQVLNRSDAVFQVLSAAPFAIFSFDWYGRAPPHSA